MLEQSFSEIFSKRLKHYLESNGITQTELAKRLHVGTTSVSNWCNGIKIPRMDKIDAMCEIFSCKRSDLITENNDSQPLTKQEWELICKYRLLTDDMKVVITGAIDAAYHAIAKRRKDGMQNTKQSA